MSGKNRLNLTQRTATLKAVASPDQPPKNDGENSMQTEIRTTKAQAADTKIRTGALMNIEEVAAKLDVSLSTVHRLALPSIRIGRQLRYDPQDLLQLIRSNKEEVLDA